MTAAEVVQVLIPVAVFSMAVGFIVGNALAKTSQPHTIYRVDTMTQEPRYNTRGTTIHRDLPRIPRQMTSIVPEREEPT